MSPACSPSTPDDLLPTELPPNVYAGLKASPVTDVHVFGRRGPMQVKFTPLELRELGELRDVDMVVYDEDFDYDEARKLGDREQQAGHGASTASSRRGARARPGRRAAGCTCTSSRSPVEVLGDADGRRDRLQVRAHRGRRRGRHPAAPGEFREVPVQAVYRAVGYFGSRARRACRSTSAAASSRTARARSSTTTTTSVPRRVRDRLDQARTGRPDRPHQVRRDGDRPPPRQRPGARGGRPSTRRSRRSSTCSRSAASSTPTSTAGTASTSTSWRSAAAEGRARIKVVPRDEMIAISNGR